jgi:PIN domain nuclease of toxin-antitoxin system
LWEIVIKLALGKLHLSLSLAELKRFLVNHQFQILQMNFDHLETLRQMPFHHGDPFDRLIIAQAIAEQMLCLSVDQSFKHYSELRLISE